MKLYPPRLLAPKFFYSVLCQHNITKAITVLGFIKVYIRSPINHHSNFVAQGSLSFITTFINVGHSLKGMAKSQKSSIEKFEGISYKVWVRNDKEHKRGCFSIGKRHIHSYPHIKRVLSLEKGIKKKFGEEEFYVEEKIDGYNIRALWAGEKIFCFTRSGHVDAFSTDRLRGSVVEELAKSGYVVCGEMVGNTPYTDMEDSYDIRFYVFDLFKGNRRLSPEERREVMGGIEGSIDGETVLSVPSLGKFSIRDIEKLKKAVVKMDKEGKEGIVMKRKTEAIKYVLARHEIKAFVESYMAPFDYSPGFFKERAIRAALFMDEMGVNENMGMCVEEAVMKAVRQVKERGRISKRFRVRVNNYTTWTDIKKRLSESKDIYIREVASEERNGKLEVVFEKVYVKSSAKLRSFLSGSAFVD
ncbi:MAG: RNA ligase [Methanobacteriota archaeon]|nr:MAG: RNA ligase [Euryarchaeota archaeon]